MYMRKLLRRRHRFGHRVQLWRWSNHTIASCRFRSWLWLGSWHVLWLRLWLKLRNIFQKIHRCISEEANPDQRYPHAEDAQDSAARHLGRALFRGSQLFRVLTVLRLTQSVSITRFVRFVSAFTVFSRLWVRRRDHLRRSFRTCISWRSGCVVANAFGFLAIAGRVLKGLGTATWFGSVVLAFYLRNGRHRLRSSDALRLCLRGSLLGWDNLLRCFRLNWSCRLR